MKKSLLVALLLFAITLCACNKQPDVTPAAPAPTSENPAAGQPAVEYDDTIIFGNNSDITTLYPHSASDNHSVQVCMMVYDTLFKMGEDGTPYPWLVEDYSLSDDSLTWSFKLKEGVMFHDGKELTAQMVKDNFERLMPPATHNRVCAFINMWKEFNVLDNYRFEIVTNDPYGPMLSLLCHGSLSIFDPAMWEDGDNIGKVVASVNGTGPYKLVSWNPGEELVLESFDSYFNGASPTKNIVYRVIAEDSAREIALETGEIDVMYAPPARDIPRLQQTEGLEVSITPGLGMRLFQFGCNDEIIGNTLVRQAISVAIDRNAIMNALFPNGVAYPCTGPIAPGVLGYYDMGEITQNQDKARELLAQAGYPNGFDTKIVVSPRYPNAVELGEAVSAQLKQVGINAKLEVLEWSVFAAQIKGVSPEEFDWPIFIMGVGTYMRDPDGAFRGLLTTSNNGLNDRNYGFYSNAEFDEIVFSAMKETNLDKRLEMYKRAMEILYFEDPACLYMYNDNVVIAHSDKVSGIDTNPIKFILFHNAVKVK